MKKNQNKVSMLTPKLAVRTMILTLAVGSLLTGCGSKKMGTVAVSTESVVTASSADVEKNEKQEVSAEKETASSKEKEKDSSAKKQEKVTEEKDKKNTSDKKETAATEKKTDSSKGNQEKKDAVKSSNTESSGNSGQKQETSNPSGGTAPNKKTDSETSKPAGTQETGSGAGAEESNGGSSSGSNAAGTGDDSGSRKHVHTWVKQTETIHHPAETRTQYVVDQAAWDEDIYEEEPVYAEQEIVQCCGCGAEFSDFSGYESHADVYFANDDYDHGAWSVIRKRVQTGTQSVKVDTIHHEEKGHTETIVTKDAYDEIVDNGEKCSGCGAVRS